MLKLNLIFKEDITLILLCFYLLTKATCGTNKLRTNRVFIGYITQPHTKAAALY